MAKRVKNNTGAEKVWIGQTIQPGEYYELQGQEDKAWSKSTAVIADIDAGVIIMNNGSTDLTNTEAAKLLLTDVSRSELQLVNDSVTVTPSTYTKIGGSCIWWKNRNSSYKNGVVVFECTVETKTLSVQLYDVTNGTECGDKVGVSSSGFYKFNVNEPNSTARLELRAKIESGSGGADPVVLVAMFEIDT